MRNISGRVAFVTGGGSGIGFGIAEALLDHGAKVVLADLRDPGLGRNRDQATARGAATVRSAP
jgi:NAD(P)-dependent dehydrogenase (short-subunit alcohol dehydrogenase family)